MIYTLNNFIHKFLFQKQCNCIFPSILQSFLCEYLLLYPYILFYYKIKNIIIRSRLLLKSIYWKCYQIYFLSKKSVDTNSNALRYITLSAYPLLQAMCRSLTFSLSFMFTSTEPRLSRTKADWGCQYTCTTQTKFKGFWRVELIQTILITLFWVL